ncbi:MAG: S8 family serine peptidase [Verrucomicrobia bacterium]|nr:S8 family serine peptidase [Verrucomicrobiota bacterium]
MQSLLKTRARRPNKSGWALLDLIKAIDWNRGTANRRLLRIATTLGYALALLAPSALLAAPTTIEVSPLITKSAYLAAADANQEIGVTLCLPLSDPQGAAEFARRVSTPRDVLFHRYITPQEFATRYGANAADYAALKAWAVANGLRVTQESVARTILAVRGTVAQFQNVFNTQISRYRAQDGAEFYSASVKPTVPSAIASKVSGVLGLTGSRQYVPMVIAGKQLGESPELNVVKADSSHGTGPGGAYDAANLRTAYSIPGFGSLQKETVVAVFEQGGVYVSDVEKYFKANNLGARKVTQIGVNGSPTTVVTNVPQIELEAALDIDMIAGINPSVSQILSYEDSIDPFQTALVDAMMQVADDNKASVLSISYGQDEGLQGTAAMEAENTALAQLTGEGITVLASAGDKGAYGDGSAYPYNVSDPSSQPFVTAVGGTTLFTDGNSNYSGELVWNELASNAGATGGGISSYWPLPFYQQYEPVSGYMTSNGGSSTFRNVPDVAAVGDLFTGVAVYAKPYGGWVTVGGTSVSAPIWAGYISILNAGFQYLGFKNVGYLNSLLYAVGAPFNGGQGFAANQLFDIIEGSNGLPPGLSFGNPGFSAGYGYDNCTGNGSLWGANFFPQLLVTDISSTTGPGGITNLNVTATSTSAVATWEAVSGASGYIVQLADLNVGFVYPPTKAYLTKQTKIKLTGLIPGTNSYSLIVWAISPNSFSEGADTFSTKP